MAHARGHRRPLQVYYANHGTGIASISGFADRCLVGRRGESTHKKNKPTGHVKTA
jgi:hypothetical protein